MSLQDALANAQSKLQGKPAPVAAAVEGSADWNKSGAKPSAASGSRSYRTRFPGSVFICSKVIRHEFTGGVLHTSEPYLIAELDAVSDKVGSPIYTDHAVLDESDKAPAEENARRAAAIMKDLQAAQQAALARA